VDLLRRVMILQATVWAACGVAIAMAPRFVLATMFDRRTRFAREVLIAMHAEFGPGMFDTAIRQAVRLREAAAFGLPVREVDPACRAAGDYDALARECLEYARRHRAAAPKAIPVPLALTPIEHEA